MAESAVVTVLLGFAAVELDAALANPEGNWQEHVVAGTRPSLNSDLVVVVNIVDESVDGDRTGSEREPKFQLLGFALRTRARLSQFSPTPLHYCFTSTSSFLTK